MNEIDIHKGKPKIEEAIDLMYSFLRKAYRNNEKIVKIIVGYGSTSGVSLIKDEVSKELKILKDSNQIEDYIFGKDLDITSTKYYNFKGKNLIPDIEKRIRNKGCVFILL